MARKAWLWDLLALVESGATFHITDVETTGSRAQDARVIELATVSVRDGTVVGRFETLIDPGVPVPYWITRLTGIHTRMLAGAPRPEAALEAWMAYLGGTGTFVAHNAPFDWGFLKAECERAGREWPFDKRFCTVQLARHCLPALPSRSLEALIGHYGLNPEARHRALADAEATAEVFCRLVAQLREGGLSAAR